MKHSAILLLLALPTASQAADSFVPQASFSVVGSSIVAMDQDAAGNLYVLALAQGAQVVPGTPAPYTVTSYAAPSMSPELSFSVSITTPLAFAVEANGTVDILDTGNGLTLTRYNNAGTQLAQTSRIQPYLSSFYAGAIDKANGAFYISYRSAVTQATGDFSFNILYYVGEVSKYSFSGQLQGMFALPGRTTISTTCYTPSLMSVDAQSTLWIGDQICDQVLAYNSAGTLTQDFPLIYTAYPRDIWPGPSGNVFVTESICDVNGCPHLQTYEFNSAGAQQTSFPSSSIVGETWDSRTLYMASYSANTLQRYILDAAPTAPVPSAPQGTVTQHPAAASLSWQAASDSDGDPILYSVFLGTAVGQLAYAGSTTQTSFVTSPLAFNKPYYWQVAAQDSYMGLPMLTSTSAVASFALNFIDSPPGSFGVLSGTGTVVTRSTTATFGWTPAADVYGDSITYTLTWQSAGQPANVVATGGTSVPVGNLAFGAPVTWSVTACDPYGACTPMTGGTQTYEAVFLDLPPTPPSVTGGTGIIFEHTLSPSASLAWTTTTNPQGDPIGYKLSFGTDVNALSLAQNGTQTSYSLGGISFGTTYYWQVTAYDPYGGTGTTPTQSVVVQLQNNPPGAFAVLTGTGTLFTRATAQLLSWTPSVDPDGDTVTYEVDLGTSPSALSPVQTSTATTYSLGFQFGTTYYWQVIARDGYGGATPSGVQSFLPLFLNPPPTVPANQTKTGTIPYHGFNPALSFFWGPSTDSEGDAFIYSISFGTDSSRMVTVSSAPLGYTISNLPLNQAIYYQIVATNIYGASSPSPVNWVFFQFTNNPPGPFDVVAATGTVYTRQTSATLAWTSATDPEGDPVSYGVLTGTSPAALTLLTTTPKTTAVLSNLTFGTTCYWRVDAYDGFGGTTTVNEGTQSLLYLFYNPAPPAPAISAGTGALPEHALSAQVPLSWSAVQDAAGDPTDYVVYVGTSASSLAPVQSSTQTSFAVPGAAFGTTYYWQVSAQNPYGGASTTTVSAVTPLFKNNPPGAFAVVSGTGTLLARTTTQVLTWGQSIDPDGDSVSYALSLSTNPASLAVVQASTATSYALAFAYGTTYYWSVSAFDGFGGTTPVTGGVQSFLPVFLDPAPLPVQLAPQPVIATMRGSASVSWQQVTNAVGDPVSYTVYLGDSAGALAPFAQIMPQSVGGTSSANVRMLVYSPQGEVAVAGSTITLTLSPLDYYRTYFVRIQATDPFGATSYSPVQTFTLGTLNGFPAAYNYPNPFNPLRGGTNLVFNAPPSGYAKATVEVYSEWQDLLFRQDYFNLPPGVSQVPFSGRDRYGRPFFNGSYICRVRFSNPDDQVIFYLLVVK